MHREIMTYREARKDFQVGDCITWEGEGGISAGIEFFTGHKTTHISTLLSQVREARNRWLIMEAWEGGHGLLSGEVGDNFLSRKMQGYHGRCVWRPLHPLLDSYREAIAGRLWSYMGVGYDYKGLVRQVGGRVLVDRKAMFCSELAQVCYREGIPREVLANMPWNTSMRLLVDCRQAMQPGDFADLPLFVREVEIKEG
jgi:hypothetical protein